jgi:RHH-type proline utilization regulon transcriptional repressor/proline dehydrogenase/delta 1-pyrroline-5-carboxylate dehydrogenase
VSYLACARKLLAAPDAVFPQFATHNAMTLAAIHEMAGDDFQVGHYEFQCLHGMGEPLYEEVVGGDKLNRPCRIYAPVGTHETLLAYLVRRLLENGANTSFVNRVADPDVTIADLVADPVAVASAIAPLGAPHPKIVLPRDMFGEARANSAGMDFSSEQDLAILANALGTSWPGATKGREIRNPADAGESVGSVDDATDADIEAALASASDEGAAWRDTAPNDRADILLRAADALERQCPSLIGLIVREAGKTQANALGEVREAVDFLRYYAAQVRDTFGPAHRPLGPVVCISPWNFPLAIFMGQVAAALAAGNPVLAKPAEETPLIAEQAVRILREAGVPRPALHLLQGDGQVGARLVADPRVRGVVFTGSTDVARRIQRALAERLHDGRPIPLIAETGGQNALIVDSSALPEQVVADVLASAFDSAGQRCSALRILCVQEEAAERVRAMLLGAMAELSVGDPRRLSTDVGPVITAEAAATIRAHIEAMRARGHAVHQVALAPDCEHGTFVPPTLIEIDRVGALTREVFGPVLHFIRYRRDRLDALLDDIDATGYGLTFGVQSRIDETIAHATARSHAGNIYVNRNLIGAVVGVQPFGGHGLSGTGPKAGGPLYPRRLLSDCPPLLFLPTHCLTPDPVELPGPVGERNVYALVPRGTILCVADTPAALDQQRAAVLATGNRVSENPAEAFDAVLIDGDLATLQHWNRVLADRDGAIVPLLTRQPSGHFALEWLLRERAISTNTAAAGGNASLMSIG